jgi:hypothetical protein
MHIERNTFDSITTIRLSGEVVKLTAELPGMEEKDIEVNVSDDVLTIKGEKKEDHYVSERHYASFQRSFHSTMLSSTQPRLKACWSGLGTTQESSACAITAYTTIGRDLPRLLTNSQLAISTVAPQASLRRKTPTWRYVYFREPSLPLQRK